MIKLHLSKNWLWPYFLTLLSVTVLFTSFKANATDYKISKNEHSVIEISSRGQNKITVVNDRIAEVTGPENEFTVEVHSDIGEALLMPLTANKEIEVTFITEDKKILLLRLLIKDIEPQIISLHVKENDFVAGVAYSSYGTNISGLGSDDFRYEIIRGVKEIYSGKGVTKNTNPECSNAHKSLELISSIELLSKYKIIKALVKNKSKETIKITEKDFMNCENGIVAIAFDGEEVLPNASFNLFLVTR